MSMHIPVQTLIVLAAVFVLAAMAWPQWVVAGGPVWPRPSSPLVEVDQVPVPADAGGLEQGVWAKAPPAGPFFHKGSPEPDGRRTELKMLTSKGVLYVAARCRDQADNIKAAPDTADLSKDDSIELVFALGGQGFYPLLQVQVNAAGVCRAFREPVPQSNWRSLLPEGIDPSLLKATAKIDRGGWWVVVELPMAALAIPTNGLRMNVVRNRSVSDEPAPTTRPGHAPPGAALPAGEVDAEHVLFAWSDLWGGPMRNTFRLGTVTPAKEFPAPLPRLELPAGLAVGGNELKFADWRDGLSLLVNGQPAKVDAKGAAAVNVLDYGPAELVVRDAAGADLARYACDVPRPLIVHAVEPFQADLAKPISVELTLELPRDAKAEVTLDAVQAGKSVGRQKLTLASGKHPVELAIEGAKAGDVRLEATAAIPLFGSAKPLQVQAAHWCMVGVEAAVVDRFRDGIEKLPTAALLRAGSADAGNYWRAVQAGNGLFTARGSVLYWPQGMVYVPALLYKTNWPENPYFKDRRFLDSAAAGLEWVIDPAGYQELLNEPDNRGMQGFLWAYDLIKDDVPPAQAARFKARLMEISEHECEIWDRPVDYRYSRYSADTGTGVNHWALHTANVYTAGKVFGRADWLAIGKRELLKLAAHEENGQFAERRGIPTPSYNRLTQTALAEYYFQSGDESVRPNVVREAEYCCGSYLFEGAPMTVHDGRVNAGPHVSCWTLPLSLTAPGRALARTCALNYIGPQRHPSRGSGEDWHRLAEAALAYRDGEESPWATDGEFCYMDGLALVVRKAGFQYGLSGISLPPIISLYRLDPQNAVELFHAQAGAILRGNNSQNQPEAGSFRRVVDGKPVWLSWDGLIQRTADGHVVTLTYSNFKTRVWVRVLGEGSAEVKAELIEAQGPEPVVYSFFPAGAPVAGEGGRGARAAGGGARAAGGGRGPSATLTASEDGRKFQFGTVTIEASAPTQLDRAFKIYNPYSGKIESGGKPFRAFVTLKQGTPFVLKVTVGGTK